MLHKVAQGLLELLWPPRTTCLLCDTRLDPGGQPTPAGLATQPLPPQGVCGPCWETMPFPRFLPRCENCSRPLVGEARICDECTAGVLFGRVFALGLMEGPLREAIHFLKFHGREELGYHLGRSVGARIPPGFDCMLPIPLHRSRFAERGFNQAAAIAAGIAAVTHIPVLRRGLARNRSTGHQARLQRAGRMHNLEGAFFALSRRPPWAGKTVLLVDDVLTTGATVGEVARILSETGAATVATAVVAVSSTPMRGN